MGKRKNEEEEIRKKIRRLESKLLRRARSRSRVLYSSDSSETDEKQFKLQAPASKDAEQARCRALPAIARPPPVAGERPWSPPPELAAPPQLPLLQEVARHEVDAQPAQIQIPGVDCREIIRDALLDVPLKMSEENTIRHRLRESKPNGIIKHENEKIQDPEFKHRESPLTFLINTSLHIRAIYHIFVVILLVLLFDTVIYDLVERGKINVGISTVKYGFGDIGRGAKLWFFEFSITLLFYPGLLLYTAGARALKNHLGIRQLIWQTAGIAGLLALQGALVTVPVLDLHRKHLALASGVIVTCEMFRFAMKIHAIAVACAPRWRDGSAPLPTFRHYLYYLFAPTLIYRDQYLRTKKIRWGSVIFNFLEVAAIIFFNSFLWERFILPYWSEYGKESKVEAGTVVRGMFACVLPGLISFLCGFYCLLHAWLNAFAEMLKFADRLFYEEWWTTSQFGTYYRAWNRVVHSWLRDHLYKPLIPYTGRAGAVFAVFFISACAHEVILALSFGFFYPVLLMEFGVFGVLMVPITAASGRRFPSAMNVCMWLSFFFGNGLLWSLYPMEYFARKNCPPSENDSFFIPKSWTCPEIVLKPNWTFQNPF